MECGAMFLPGHRLKKQTEVPKFCRDGIIWADRTVPNVQWDNTRWKCTKR